MWFLSTEKITGLTRATTGPFPCHPPWVNCSRTWWLLLSCNTSLIATFSPLTSSGSNRAAPYPQDSLDESVDTLVMALDIADAFDQVWHSALLTKLRAKGIAGSLLTLLQDYLQGRSLRVAVNGRTSSPAPIRDSVPQDSILVPVLWNIYIDDLLRQFPIIKAYTDDCTIAVLYCRRDNRHAVAAVDM